MTEYEAKPPQRNCHRIMHLELDFYGVDIKLTIFTACEYTSGTGNNYKFSEEDVEIAMRIYHHISLKPKLLHIWATPVDKLCIIFFSN